MQFKAPPISLEVEVDPEFVPQLLGHDVGQSCQDHLGPDVHQVELSAIKVDTKNLGSLIFRYHCSNQTRTHQLLAAVSYHAARVADTLAHLI